jgi:hypothetical protein
MIMARIVLLNALPINAFPYSEMHLIVRKVGLERIKNEIEYYTVSGVMPVISNYIRHVATVQLLSQKLGIKLEANPGLYSFMPGDVIFVITLNSPQRGQDVMQVSEQDITIYKVNVESATKWGYRGEKND